ncbi:TKL protein kinase [Saprolegnia parasitica CBS 223.65]|uniref:TKL protein kinase n=1 Tax=Saprolegnia parasitica (strain CBS 223.65) TaxID=695850 RepID=A0A067BCK7_SAPPC|nr:TKL protein kinase [Saprolegnia parasitica CBS 223.65]KDO15838.1 TKL protein kinase [Saprolegnia parasitica CBS 223.65]|eukprot:XP_012213453.1 TKL protein kinase [Saprolegnia parasitica CBS 223.65]
MEVVFFGDEASSDDETALEVDADLVVTNTIIASDACFVQYKGVYSGSDVAVQLAYSTPQVDALRNELYIRSRLSSPYLVKLLDVRHNDSPRPVAIFEYMDHGSVRDYLDIPANKLTARFTLAVADAVARALLDLHRHGILHGDIKAANVLLASDGAIKIGHLGLAQVVDEATPRVLGTGTLCWMAPEVFEDTSYSFPADIYSYGVFLTELDARHKPYADLRLHMWDVVAGVRGGALRPTLGPDCLPWLRDLATSCLASDPEARPTAKDIVAILHELALGPP